MYDINKILDDIVADGLIKVIISNPLSKSETFKKSVIEHKTNSFQISKYTEKQVFHENISEDNLSGVLYEIFSGHYKQLNAWSENKEHIILASKKGTFTYKSKSNINNAPIIQSSSHNRTKNYILKEGNVILPLIDMGIFTPEGKIVNAMYSKYKQINRFLEIIDDEISNNNISSLNIIDFGCGKSYLTFILYYYLTDIMGIEVNIIGLDLKADVIEKCNKAAQKYGYSNLKFELGDINGYNAPFSVDMVISLHACDIATDFALYNAVTWGAKYIFSVPCCQHELNEQIKPKKLQLLSRYGIIKERFSALATDALRGNILEYRGYKTQLLEFIDLDHTPKNILIRAVKRPNTQKNIQGKILDEIKQMIEEFAFEPTLYKLLIK